MNRNMPDAIRGPARATGRGREGGFTLTELLVVIAVISILAGLIFGAVPRIQERAKMTNTRALIHSIDVGLEAFKTDFGHLPYTSSGNVSDDGRDIRLWLLGIRNNGDPDDSGANAVRTNQFWSGPYVDVKIDRHLDQDNQFVFIDAWREPLCFEMSNPTNDPNDPIFNMDKWDIWSRGPDMEGSIDMSAFQSGTYEVRRRNFKAYTKNGEWPAPFNRDTVGNW